VVLCVVRLSVSRASREVSVVFWLMVVSVDVWATDPPALNPAKLNPPPPSISSPLTFVLPLVISVLADEPERYSLPSVTASNISRFLGSKSRM
jgi:hypothetical protein